MRNFTFSFDIFYDQYNDKYIATCKEYSEIQAIGSTEIGVKELLPDMVRAFFRQHPDKLKTLDEHIYSYMTNIDLDA